MGSLSKRIVILIARCTLILHGCCRASREHCSNYFSVDNRKKSKFAVGSSRHAQLPSKQR